MPSANFAKSQPLHNPARLRYRASFAVVLCVIAVGALLTLTAANLFALGLTLAMCGACLLPAVAALWWHSRWLDRKLKDLQVDHLAHWTFSEEEWPLVLLLDDEWRRENSSTARAVGCWFGAIGGMIVWLGWFSPEMTLHSLSIGVVATVLGGILGWSLAALASIMLSLCQRLPERPSAVMIGREVIWFSGRLYQLRELGFTPVAAYFHPGTQPFLEFVYQQMDSSGPVSRRARVPVPQSAVDSPEFYAVMATFNA